MKMETKNKLKSKYIDPFTSFGFKKLFGEDCDKDMLIDFLNALFQKREIRITGLNHLTSRKLGKFEEDKYLFFDYQCENEKGETFIVEIQKPDKNIFQYRPHYYVLSPFLDHSTRNEKGSPIYTVAILDFRFSDDKNATYDYMSEFVFTDVITKEVLHKHFMFICLEMPNFNKSADELTNRFEKWMYVIKNLNSLDGLPDRLQDEMFEKLLAVNEIANLDENEYDQYIKSLSAYRD